MKNIAIPATIVIIISLGMGCGVLNGEVKEMKISKDKILEIANAEAIKLGYSTDQMKVYIDENNNLWNKYVSSSQILESNPRIKDKLNNRNFWAIYYEPKEMQFGGDIFIFIDKNTGDIILTLPGK